MKRAYQELFSRELTEDMALGFCEGDEFYEDNLKDELANRGTT